MLMLRTSVYKACSKCTSMARSIVTEEITGRGRAGGGDVERVTDWLPWNVELSSEEWRAKFSRNCCKMTAAKKLISAADKYAEYVLDFCQWQMPSQVIIYSFVSVHVCGRKFIDSTVKYAIKRRPTCAYCRRRCLPITASVLARLVSTSRPIVIPGKADAAHYFPRS